MKNTKTYEITETGKAQVFSNTCPNRTKIHITSKTYILYDHKNKTYTLWEKGEGAYIERPLTREEAMSLIKSHGGDQ